MVGIAVVANLANQNEDDTNSPPDEGAPSATTGSPDVAPKSATGSDETPQVTTSPASGPVTTEPAASVPATSEPANTEPVTVGSREDPIPLGEPATITLNAIGDADKSTWTLTVDGPGEDITQTILDENQFNDPPPEGQMFYGVPVTLTLTDADKEPLSILFNLQLEYFGPSSLSIIDQLSSDGCGVAPNQIDVTKEVFIGGAISGVMCYAVSNQDVEGGILITTDDIDGDRLFMATR